MVRYEIYLIILTATRPETDGHVALARRERSWSDKGRLPETIARDVSADNKRAERTS